MPRKFLRKYLPDPHQLREHKHLRVFGERLSDPNLWHLNRRSVANATFIGLFCAMLPIPLHMIPAAMLAIAFRANLPLSVALVWVTNPLTIIPAAWAAYRLGAALLGVNTNWSISDIGPEWLMANFPPLAVGALLIGLALAICGRLAIQYLWRAHVRRQWRLRVEARCARRRDQA